MLQLCMDFSPLGKLPGDDDGEGRDVGEQKSGRWRGSRPAKMEEAEMKSHGLGPGPGPGPGLINDGPYKGTRTVRSYTKRALLAGFLP